MSITIAAHLFFRSASGPTPEQIKAGTAQAKSMIPMNEVPIMFRHLITDEKITDAVTKILTAALNAKGAA